MYVVMLVSVMVLSEWLLGNENDDLYGVMVLISGGCICLMMVLLMIVMVSELVLVVVFSSSGF